MINITGYGKVTVTPQCKSFIFPGGEVQVKITGDLEASKTVTIDARLRSSNDIMELLMVTDALRHLVGNISINLNMPYIPYARQDRVCDHGEALAIKVFADLINSQNYMSVLVWDSHSDVATALINRCWNVEQSAFIGRVPELLEIPVLVSPDAGANKKVYKLAKSFPNFKTVIRADKTRNPTTGEIIGTVVYCDDLGNQDVLIADDCIDGGKTFIELSKKLREKTRGKIYLYATHAIFSKGLDVFKGLIDRIYIANSFIESDDPILHIIR